MNSTGTPSCADTSRSCMWLVSAYGIKLLESNSGLFLSEGVVPAPEYPETPKHCGGPANWSSSGAMVSCIAVA